jgi:hypothetical protein
MTREKRLRRHVDQRKCERILSKPNALSGALVGLRGDDLTAGEGARRRSSSSKACRPRSPGSLSGSSRDRRWVLERVETMSGIAPAVLRLGPAGCGKSEIVRVSVAEAGVTAIILPLSAASPDRCLQQFLGVRTKAELFNRLGVRRDTPFVLDALETVQDPHIGGYRISDLRLLHLLAFVSCSVGRKVRVLVASRLPPPLDLDSAAISLVELPASKSPGNKRPFLAAGFASDQMHSAGDEAFRRRLVRLSFAGWLPHRPLFVWGLPNV